MKTERITLLSSVEFKAFLTVEAEKEGISVSELVRRRCERAPSDDERMLLEVLHELQRVVGQAKCALESGLSEIHDVLTELKTEMPGQ